MDVTSENRLAIHYRRSVRVLKKEALVDEKSKRMHSFMTLAPTSSNTAMEFYHITSNEVLSKLSGACFNQSSKKQPNKWL
jgi:nitroreductase